MLKIYVPAMELYISKTNEFVYTKPVSLSLEHSLLSVSKWEAKWKKPFIAKSHTKAEMADYIRCMTLGQEADKIIYDNMPPALLKSINDYINDEMTATWFSKRPNGVNVHATGRSSAITSELIYYWMVEHGIPFECQKWHLNRLLTLIRICNIKSQGSKKMSKSDILKQNAAANAARRKH